MWDGEKKIRLYLFILQEPRILPEIFQSVLKRMFSTASDSADFARPSSAVISVAPSDEATAKCIASRPLREMVNCPILDFQSANPNKFFYIMSNNG